MHATFFIPRENEGRFTEALDKLAKKAEKLGLSPITHVAVKTLALERTRDKTCLTEDGCEVTKSYPVTLEHVAYTVEGDAPTLAGWEFVATLEHVDGHTLLRSVSDEPLPERFRTADPRDCDHCGYVRRRTDTFVVRNVDTGEYKQVGRSCMKDFLGNKSPGAIAAYLTQLQDFLAGFDGEDGGWYGLGGSAVETRDLVIFLAATVAAISEDGWTSRTVAREMGTFATADAVLAHFNARANPRMSDEARKAATLPGADSEAAITTAKEAIDWAKAQEPTNDYLHNLYVILELDYVTRRTAGYAASIVSSYYRATERNLRKAVLKAEGADHVGTVGKRAEMTLTLLGVHSIEGYYGTTHIHRFADSNGNDVVWFASNARVVPSGPGHEEGYNGCSVMVAGATYRVKASIKKHGEYNGKPQTVVTRVAVQPLTKPKRVSKKKKVAAEVSP